MFVCSYVSTRDWFERLHVTGLIKHQENNFEASFTWQQITLQAINTILHLDLKLKKQYNVPLPKQFILSLSL